MNRNLLAALLISLVTTGCSSVIVGRGQYRNVLSEGSTREQVRAAIGHPLSSGDWKGGEHYSYDYFRINGRVAPNEHELFLYTTGIIYSLGLVEIYAFPASLVMVPLDCRKEHDLWVYYRPDNSYFKHETDSWPFSVRSSNEKWNAQQAGGDEPPPRASVRGPAEIRESLVRSTVPVGGGRSP